SHDRYFISQLANKLLFLENGKAEFFDGTYQEYEDKKNGTVTVQPKSKKETKKEELPKEEVKPEKKLSPAAVKRQITKLEDTITRKEAELEEKRQLRFEPEYYQDYEKMNALNDEIDQVHNDLAHLYSQWDELSEQEEESK
ncbi:MAG: ABC transporter ATP-binding protein, partial [Solobacterium sp.]|nr:ABC transporter ATP-binding protein [Solobacterium sp.]